MISSYPITAVSADDDPQTVLSLKLFGHPFKRRLQADFVEHRQAQFKRQGPGFLNGAGDEITGFIQLPNQFA